MAKAAAPRLEAPEWIRSPFAALRAWGQEGSVNPTLAARLKRQHQLTYWRTHPPAPFAVPTDPPTALLHQPIWAPSQSSPRSSPQLPLAANPSGQNELIPILLAMVLLLVDGLLAIHDLVRRPQHQAQLGNSSNHRLVTPAQPADQEACSATCRKIHWASVEIQAT